MSGDTKIPVAISPKTQRTQQQIINSDSPIDDGLAALQLPFLQNDEISRFLSPSKEWSLAPTEKDINVFDEVDNGGSPADFFGHYSNPNLFLGGRQGGGVGGVGQDGYFDPSIQSQFAMYGDIQSLSGGVPSHSGSHSGSRGQSVQISQLQAPSVQNQNLPVTPNVNFESQTPDSSLQSFLSNLNSDSPSNFIGSGLGSGNDSKYFVQSPFNMNLSDSKVGNGDGNGNNTIQNQNQTQTQTHPPSSSSTIIQSKWSSSTTPSSMDNTQPQSNHQSELQRKSDIIDEEIRQHLNSTRYLFFLPAHKETVLYDLRGNRTEIDLSVSLSGNFFLSEPHPSSLSISNDSSEQSSSKIESHNSPESPNPSPSSEKKDLMKYDLTFYRRNLFHVSATVSNAHNAVYAGNSENPLLRSRILSLSLAVNVLDDKTPKQLLYCPPKSTFNPNDKKSDNQDPAVKFIYPKSSGYDEVVNWKRLQFRTATAHNGRKKLQNYFSVCVSVYAELENAQRVCLVKSYSRQIVVRGRNPRFYQNRDNIMIPDGTGGRGGVIGGQTKSKSEEEDRILKDQEQERFQERQLQERQQHERQQQQQQQQQHHQRQQQQQLQQRERERQQQLQLQHQSQIQPPQQPPHHPPQPQAQLQSFQVQQPHQQSFQHIQSQHNIQSTQAHAPLPQIKQERWSSSSSEFKKNNTGNSTLSIGDDDGHSDDGPGYVLKMPTGDESVSPKNKSSQTRDIDYEYFPMPLNYWLPPVEVVYRPHAIHHPLKYQNVPQEQDLITPPPGAAAQPIKQERNAKRFYSSVE